MEVVHDIDYQPVSPSEARLRAHKLVGEITELLILVRCPPHEAELIKLTPLQLHSLLAAAMPCIETKTSPLNGEVAGKIFGA